jgi:NAD(P)-dependent dehydrogenase (short-subunit alcohol dehydrogenase family)
MAHSLTVLVTGANSGIGRATALLLAERGHTVFGAMRDLAKGAKLVALAAEAGLTVTPVRIDVGDAASVTAGIAEVVARGGPVHVLVNNAGVGSNSTAEDCPVTRAAAIMDTNLFGAWRCIDEVLPAMREQGAGHIVQVSSIAGRLAIAGQAAYCASKWALEAMSECLAGEVAPFGVRVSIIEPGVTRTPMLAKDVDAPAVTAYEHTYARLIELYAAGIAANVRPEVVAETIAAAIDAAADPDLPPRLRWPCAWGGEEIVTRRPGVSDEDYVALGALAPDGDAWRARIGELFGLSIEPFPA